MVALVSILLLCSPQMTSQPDISGLWVSIATNGVEYKAWMRFKRDGTWQARVAQKGQRDDISRGTYKISNAPDFPAKHHQAYSIDTYADFADNKPISKSERTESYKKLLFTHTPDGDLITDILTINFARVEQVARMRKVYGERPDPGKRIHAHLKSEG